MVVVYKKYGGHGWVGTPSDLATLLRHNTTKRLPTPAVGHNIYSYEQYSWKFINVFHLH